MARTDHPERTRRLTPTDRRVRDGANVEPVRNSRSSPRSIVADPPQNAQRERYDAVDLRLMDTFPASDAVARY